MWHSWHLSGREGGRGAIPCRMLHPQLLIRTSTIWSRWCFLSLLRWVVFPKGWGCVCLVEVVSGATCGGIVFSNHWCGFVSKKQLNRVVLLGNALTSSCRWQGCPSLSRLFLWIKSSAQVSIENTPITVIFWNLFMKMQKTILSLSV